MLTPDEYMAIMRLVTSERESEGASLADRRADDKTANKKRSRKKSARARKMAKAIPQAKDKMTKANGQFRKGKTMSHVMRLANKLADKM